jgi:hypothetical protein
MAANANGSLSHQQERAVQALLTERTLVAAAEAAGVGERTLRRWLSQDQGFLSAYRTARRRVVEVGIADLQRAASEAVETLRRNLSCGSPQAEIRAALAIVDLAIRGVDLVDHEERISDLERRTRA